MAAGCTASLRHSPDLAGLYNRAAQAGDLFRNPVIVIPGILGSKLRDRASGRVVWGAFSGTYANPRRPDGARLAALPMAYGARLADLRDDVEPAGVLDRVEVSLLGLPVEQQAYLHILRALGAGGYRDETLGRMGQIEYGPGHFTCFQFDYDWRRDNVENAQRLDTFIREKRAYVATELERRHGIRGAEVRFDIVAHSMGGLLTRYYLRYGGADLLADGAPAPLTWAGARFVERAILIGTPNAGSVQALSSLVEGTRLAFFLPRYPPAVLGSMPALYQLLPRTRHGSVRLGNPAGPPLDLFDPAVWERLRWGLADPAQDPVLRWLLPEVPDPVGRRQIALEHLRKVLARAARFQAALDAPASPPPGLTLHLFAGDAEPTAALVVVDADGAPRVRARAPGDGTVTRASALMDERPGQVWSPGILSPIAWNDVTFLFSDHLGMTKDPAFTDNILFRLLESPRRGPLATASGTP